MMRFGKMNGDALEEHRGKTVVQDGRVYVNVREDTLLRLGYKPIEVEECVLEEREGYAPVCVYTDEGDVIKGMWRYAEVDE